MMKIVIRLAVSLSLVAVLIGFWIYNATVTPFDRSFFLSENKETIIATRVDWMCNCAGFVDTTRYTTNPVTELEDDDYFFIEPSESGQIWNRDHFIKNRYVRLTGQFYIDKGIPNEFPLGQMEDKPNHAKVFRYDKIEYLTND